MPKFCVAIEIVSKKLDSCLVLFHVRNGNAESKKNNLEQGNQHGDLKQRRWLTTVGNPVVKSGLNYSLP